MSEPSYTSDRKKVLALMEGAGFKNAKAQQILNAIKKLGYQEIRIRTVQRIMQGEFPVLESNLAIFAEALGGSIEDILLDKKEKELTHSDEGGIATLIEAGMLILRLSAGDVDSEHYKPLMDKLHEVTKNPLVKCLHVEKGRSENEA